MRPMSAASFLHVTMCSSFEGIRMKLDLYNIAFELTRRCNAKCQHCLRGPSQRKDLTREIVHNALRHVNNISSIVLTGGEPSMKPEIISFIIDELISYHINVGYFFVVTNAKSTYKRKEFIFQLNRLYDMCEDKSLCSLNISRDQFHANQFRPNLSLYDEGYTPYVNLKPWPINIENVINEGYAEKFSYGTTPAKKQNKFEIFKFKDTYQVGDPEVYISSNGNVVSCCDMSYERIDTENLGNVCSDYLPDIIIRNGVIETQDE